MPSPCTRRTRSRRSGARCSRALSNSARMRSTDTTESPNCASNAALVAAAGADLQHLAEAVARTRRVACQQQGDHARHHRGLGDRLLMADRQAGVFVGLRGERGVDEQMARHGLQRVQHGSRGAGPRHAGAAPCGRAPAPNPDRRRSVRPCDGHRARLAQRTLRTQRVAAAPHRRGRHALQRQRKGRAATPLAHAMSRCAPRCASARQRLRRLTSHQRLVPQRQRGVVGQVDLQRRDRHAALADGVEVGALARLARVAGRADPVDRLAARIDLADHRLARMATPRRVTTRGSDAASARFGMLTLSSHGRGRSRQGAQHTLDDVARHARRGVELRPSPSRPARTRSPECRTDSLPSPRPRCPNTACRRPCWRRC